MSVDGVVVQAQIGFDFAGCLALCRRLWETAAILESGTATRIESADAARTEWIGPHRDNYDELFSIEVENSAQLVLALKAEALAWADLWVEMKVELNRRQHALDLEGASTISDGWTPSRPATPREPQFQSADGWYGL